MERDVVDTNTDTVNKLVDKVVNLYFTGISVKEALKEVMTVEVLRKKLDRLITEKNYELTDPEIIRLSKRLDRHIVKQQKRLKSFAQDLNPNENIIKDIISNESGVV